MRSFHFFYPPSPTRGEGGGCAFSLVGFSEGVVCLSPDSAVSSGIREDLSDFTSGSFVSPQWLRQPWYSSLVELSVVHAVRLPLAWFPSRRRISHTCPPQWLPGSIGTAFSFFGLQQKMGYILYLVYRETVLLLSLFL